MNHSHLDGVPRVESLQRTYYLKSVPCFHCSKSLQQLSSNHPTHASQYLGFLVEGPDKLMHPIHGSCVEMYFLDFPCEGEWTAIDEAAEKNIVEELEG